MYEQHYSLSALWKHFATLHQINTSLLSKHILVEMEKCLHIVSVVSAIFKKISKVLPKKIVTK